MDRPPSQLENVRPSGLKPPSRLPAMSSNGGRNALLDTSQSDLNARSGGMTGSMGPPVIPTKHKIPGLPEPAPKRKTLAERAGEPIHPRSGIPPPTKATIPRVTSHIGHARTASAAATATAGTTNGFRPASRQQRVASVEEDNEAEAGATGKRKAWDTKGRLDDMEQMYSQLRSQFASAADSKAALEESLSLYKSRVQELTQLNKELATTQRTLTADVERARADLHTTTTDLRQARRDHERDMQDVERRHEKELNDVTHRLEKEKEALARERAQDAEKFRREAEEARRLWERQKDSETADLTTAHWEEMDELKQRHEKERAELQRQVEELRNAGESRATESADEVQNLRSTITSLEQQLEATNATVTSLRARVAAEQARCAALDHEKTALVSKTHFLEGNQEAQSLEFTTMSQKLQDAIAAKEGALVTLRKEEMLRRKLNATILELRGNIRVFVRIRPLLAGEEEPAKVDFPDVDSLDGGREVVVHAPKTVSATGKERSERHNYAFDRVFAPATPNQQVFEDCRDLIQSVVDGYNVAILSYGQTGSGKTFGMSGPHGIIPSSISLLLAEMARLKEKGWAYEVDASFVEVYNETINDLLGDAKTWEQDEDLNASVRGKKKMERHEIHHDAVTGKTTVTNLSSVSLWPPPSSASDDGADIADEQTSFTERAVDHLLDTASRNRRVAATKSNERSSRSHSIFMLTLRGRCEATGESSEGVLNLVDLAGSERLKQSGAEGNRAKETAAINKSLSALGDVIASLGSKKGDESHVPYRNSKLTYLLQSSLGGTAANGKSSRTLMLLHLSPLQAHWQESRSSLLFGSKVHGTYIGAGKKK